MTNNAYVLEQDTFSVAKYWFNLKKLVQDD